MKYIYNFLKFFVLLGLCLFLGMKIFDIYARLVFHVPVLAEFTFASVFILTLLMFLYGIYSFFCDLFGIKKYELSTFFDSKEKPQYD
ncbi:hypothetical protein CN918_32210 [Priestia megaterium]|nr:hypothetical protein CN918_32210 [Priestia megaterium]